MTTALTQKTTKLKYRVESVEKTPAPEGMPEGNWYRYVIGAGPSRIEGLKPGTLKAVTAHAETVVDDLNSRTSRAKVSYAAGNKAR